MHEAAQRMAQVRSVADRDELIAKAFAEGASKEEICAMAGISMAALNSVFKKMDLRIGARRQQRERDVVEFYAAKPSPQRIHMAAQHFELSVKHIRNILNKHGQRKAIPREPARELVAMPSLPASDRADWPAANDKFLRRLIPAAIRARAIPPHAARRVAAEAARLRLPVELVGTDASQSIQGQSIQGQSTQAARG